jgi:nitroreductase
MDAIQTILTRRSIRKFKETKIPDKAINKIIECALSAPSARNQQPCHLIIVNERKLLNAIMEAHPNAKMLDKAPLAIIICGDTNIEPNMDYIALDCAAMTQNILLATHALGLAGVWIGVYNRKEREAEIRKIFNLPHNIIPISITAIGYADEIPAPIERITEGRIHYNKF